MWILLFNTLTYLKKPALQTRMHQRPTLSEVVMSSEMTQITRKKVRELENDIRLAFIIFFAFAGNILPTPLRSSYPEESRRDRSQTAPEPETGSASLHRTALKRNAVSEAQLDALQHAYAVVADTDGVSQKISCRRGGLRIE